MPRGVNPVDAARLQGRLWTPAVLGSSLGAWFDAGDLATIAAASSAVSQWSDKSGFARHATASSNKPTFSATSFRGGLPAISFSGAANAAAGQGLAVPSIAATGWTALEAFYVFSDNADPPSGNSTAGTLLPRWGTVTISEDEPYSDGGVYLAFGSTVRKTCGNPTPSFTSPRLVRIRSAASDWQYWIDGASFFTTASNTVGLGSAPTIGNSPSGFNLDGKVKEIVVVNRATTLREQSLLEGYLAWNAQSAGIVANLPASHRFKSRPPMIGD